MGSYDFELARETEHAQLKRDTADLRADRDRWIRLFNRLQGAIQHHKNAKRGDNWDYTDEADEALYAAMDRVLRDAAGFDR